MAFCPKCNGEMKFTDAVCPHCGYDFPHAKNEGAKSKRSFPYSPLADVALIAATIAAFLGCLITVFAAVSALMSRDGGLLYALVIWPIAFFVQLGNLVVLLRVQDMDRA
jgi:uncharacterized membrane protein YvbJ